MKRVLVIAYLYPPIFNSGTRRSLEFVNHLPDNGWTPVVLTVAEPDPRGCDESLLAEVRAGTRIERAPMGSAALARRISALCGAIIDHKRLADALKWRIQQYWQVPDKCASWVPPAVAKARQLHATEPFDAIYASGWPWSSFLVAERVGRATGVPFVVDYRDLWQPGDVAWDQASWLQRRINPWLERRVLRRAAAVIATTKSFLDLLPQAQLPRHRFHVTNGFDPRDFPTRQPASASAPDIVTIIYTGMWRPGYGPNDLYAAVQLLHARGSAALARLRIVTAGFSPGRARAYGIEAYVEERGRIPHAQATEMMCSANAVYLPVSQGVYEYASMPGKLFEYLGSGRPVLASALAESEVARTLTQVGGALRIEPGDIASLASALERLCAGANDIFSARNTGELAMYTRANLTGKLASVLDTVARQRHGD